MGYEPIAPHTWDGETAISGTDVLEVATIYKVYVRALFRALFRWIYHNIALKYMALYGSSSIGPDIPSETYFGRSMWATLTWDTRLSHLEPIFKAMRTANTKRSLIFQVFFDYCKLWWSMLSDVGATDPRKRTTMSPTLGDSQCSSDVCSWDTDL